MHHIRGGELNKKSHQQHKHKIVPFNEISDNDTEDGKQKDLLQYNIQRQKRMIQDQENQKINKKLKMNDFSVQNLKMRTINQEQQNQFKEFLRKKPYTFQRRNDAQSDEQIQQKTIQLLNDFLRHKKNEHQTIVNVEIANKWILDENTPIKLKSFLILYMILNQFQRLGFKFIKKLDVNIKSPQQTKKTITIQKTNRKQITDQIMKSQQYQIFKQTQVQQNLRDYLEWLIYQKYQKIEFTQKDFVFHALAFNQRERVSMELINQKYQKKYKLSKTKSVFLSIFLMNAENPLYRETIDQSINQNTIYLLQNQKISSFPDHEWIVGLNFAVRYFYKKKLNERIQQCLIKQKMRKIEQNQYQFEFKLLENYVRRVQKQNLKSQDKMEKSQAKNQHEDELKISLTDKILQWIFINAIPSNNQPKNSNVQQNNSKIFVLNQSIARQFLVHHFSQIIQAKVSNNQHHYQTEDFNHKLLTVLLLLQSEKLITDDQKDRILSQILYKVDKLAIKNAKLFEEVIPQLQHTKISTLPSIYQRLLKQYNHCYKFVLLSQQSSIKYDVLAQLKYLTQIDSQMLQKYVQIRQRIFSIITSFNLISHWNKEITLKLLSLLLTFVDKLKNAQEKQLLQSLSLFLKININIQPLNTQNLTKMIKFIQKINQKRNKVIFQQSSIKFIQSHLLQLIFEKQSNSTLVLQLKFLSEVNESKENKKQDVIKEQKMIEQKVENNKALQQKKIDIVEQLRQIAKGWEYYENKIKELKGRGNEVEQKG